MLSSSDLFFLHFGYFVSSDLCWRIAMNINNNKAFGIKSKQNNILLIFLISILLSLYRR